MTEQTKRFIELSDILAIRCECRNKECRASLSIPLAQVMGRTVRVCPSCKEPWAQFGESTYETLFTDLIEKMKALDAAKLGCALSLEVRCEEEEESA